MKNATYSPEDNKLRLYSSERLDAETYARVKKAGFSWAPRQGLFVAPAWTPSREDLLIELCGEVGDEDTSLVERAEERAERFGNYADHRMDDAESAREAVSAIADNIPLGQPILVGHHSEARARRDAEKIENGMRRAVRMWETSKYWTDRARGAIGHAKYKELPAVRSRRIKKLEAELRKVERAMASRAACLKLWEGCEDLGRARLIAGRTEAGWLSCCKHPTLDQYLHPSDVLPFDDRSDYAKDNYPTWTLEQVKERAREAYGPSGGGAEYGRRWIAHLNNRLAYERAMLDESGGTVADHNKPEKGGACKCWASPRGGWSEIVQVNRVSVTIMDNWGNGGRDFRRTIPFDKLTAVLSKADWDRKKAGQAPDIESADVAQLQRDAERCKATREKYETEAASDFGRMKATLRGDTPVQVVSAPQLFPTPCALAERMVSMADIQPGNSVLEPSAGTGRLLEPMFNGEGTEALFGDGKLVMVEINHQLSSALRREYVCGDVMCADFLALNGELGSFDRIVMNPPFANDQDIAHVRHAWEHLKPGGRIVSVMSPGFTFGETKARREFRDFVDDNGSWEMLPDGSFAESGTNVRAALVVLNK